MNKNEESLGSPRHHPKSIGTGRRNTEQNETNLLCDGRNGMGKKKKTKTEGSGVTTQWPEHPQLVSNQCKEGGPMVKGFTKGMVWWRGKIAYFRFPVGDSFGEMLCWDGILPIKGGRRLGPLDTCQ